MALIELFCSYETDILHDDGILTRLLRCGKYLC
jgi:hypothetical protein